MMNRSILFIAVAVLAIAGGSTAVAQPEIKSATYTITQVRQYHIQVVRIIGRSLTVDVEGIGRRKFQVPRDFTFDIDGEAMTLNQLRPGQKLRAYVTERETGELFLMQDETSTDGVMGETVTDEEPAPEDSPTDPFADPSTDTSADDSAPEAPQPAPEPRPEPDSAAVSAPEPDDRLAQVSFESPATESPPAQLPATAGNSGWMAVAGGALVIAGFGVGWHRRNERRPSA